MKLDPVQGEVVDPFRNQVGSASRWEWVFRPKCPALERHMPLHPFFTVVTSLRDHNPVPTLCSVVLSPSVCLFPCSRLQGTNPGIPWPRTQSLAWIRCSACDCQENEINIL